MKSSETKAVAYMQGASKRFVLPAYQENYNLKSENCNQLFEVFGPVLREVELI